MRRRRVRRWRVIRPMVVEPDGDSAWLTEAEMLSFLWLVEDVQERSN